MQCTKDEKKECLPPIIECANLAEWNLYLDNLYAMVFKPQFVDSNPIFQGMKVYIRREPMDGKWEHGFTHMTHEDLLHTSNDPNDRIPDFRRSERLNWVRPIIENYACSIENDCGQILYWEELYRGRVRSHLLFLGEKFLVVLERKKFGFFIITSFYIKEEYELEKRVRKYNMFKKQKTPLA